MKFKVFTIRRAGVPKQRYCWQETSVIGRLVMDSEHHSGFHRHTLTARIVDDDDKPIADFEPLYDAVLMSAKTGWWTMRGIERIEKWPEHWIDYAQSWVLIPLDEDR